MLQRTEMPFADQTTEDLAGGNAHARPRRRAPLPARRLQLDDIARREPVLFERPAARDQLRCVINVLPVLVFYTAAVAFITIELFIVCGLDLTMNRLHRGREHSLMRLRRKSRLRNAHRGRQRRQQTRSRIGGRAHCAGIEGNEQASRCEQRGISEQDIRLALARRSGRPRGADSGKIWVFGYATRGRILKVLLTHEQDVIVTAAWPHE